MYTFLSVLYVLVCLFLILVVLLQPGRGGVGGAFGGGSSQTVFGGSGAGNFLTRLTSISAALFMMLSATLAYMSSSSDKSLERATEAARAKAALRAKQNSAEDAGAGESEPAPGLDLGAATSDEPAPGDEPAAPGEPAGEAQPEGSDSVPAGNALEAEPGPTAGPQEEQPATRPAGSKRSPPTLERIVPTPN